MRFPPEHFRRGEPAPPDFIGVGALGSGTGWWHAMLLAHPEIGMRLLDKVRDEMGELAKVESAPMMEGRQMVMILAPKA